MQAEQSAINQEDLILSLFQQYKILSPSQCHALISSQLQWPLTSIRRAITNLSKAGRLIKTGQLATGLYGKPENKWRITYETDNPGTATKILQ